MDGGAGFGALPPLAGLASCFAGACCPPRARGGGTAGVARLAGTDAGGRERDARTAGTARPREACDGCFRPFDLLFVPTDVRGGVGVGVEAGWGEPADVGPPAGGCSGGVTTSGVSGSEGGTGVDGVAGWGEEASSEAGTGVAPERNPGAANSSVGSENGPLLGLSPFGSTNSGTARWCAPGTASSVAVTLSRTPKACSQSWIEATVPAPRTATYPAARRGRLTSRSIPLRPDARSGRVGARSDDAVLALPFRGVERLVRRGHEVVGALDLRERRNAEARRHVHVTRSDRYCEL